MNRMIFPQVLLLVIVAMPFCDANKNEGKRLAIEELPALSQIQINSIIGYCTVRYINIEDGFFGIESQNNKKYEPINIPEEYKTDEKKVRITFKLRDDIESKYQWGTPIELIDINEYPYVVTESHTYLNSMIPVNKGIVKFVDINEGFYGIVCNENEKFEPINLPGKYQNDGLEINFSAEYRKDLTSLNNWGTAIEIMEINEYVPHYSIKELNYLSHGTINFIDINGGFYGIECPNNAKYEPLNLPEECQVDGMKVRFTFKFCDHIESINQWGCPIEIYNISKSLKLEIIMIPPDCPNNSDPK